MQVKPKTWINGILLVVTLIVNAMGAFGMINNLSQKEVSDMYQTLITPAPFTFSIWSVIYSLLIISIVVMIIKTKDLYYEQAIEKISYLFWISCGINILWIVSFSYNLILISTILIFMLLITLTLIVKNLGKLQTEKRFLLPITFGLYSGWLFIATVVNISAWLVKIEWSGFGISEEIWSIITLMVAVVLTYIVVLKLKNAVFSLPIAWAYFGIYSVLTQETLTVEYKLLPIFALIGMILLILIAFIQFYKNKYNIMSDLNK